MVKFTESCVTPRLRPSNPSNGQTFISLNMTLSQSNIHENNADNHQKKVTEPVRESGTKTLLISKPPHSTLFCSQLSLFFRNATARVSPRCSSQLWGCQFSWELIVVLLWWPLLLEWVNLLKWDCCLTLFSIPLRQCVGEIMLLSLCWSSFQVKN